MIITKILYKHHDSGQRCILTLSSTSWYLYKVSAIIVNRKEFNTISPYRIIQTWGRPHPPLPHQPVSRENIKDELRNG